MNEYAFTLAGQTLHARADAALWWPSERVLVVSDLHLGKSERMARRGGELLPPYETRETLKRLDMTVEQTDPARVICLGDSFDDADAARALDDDDMLWLSRLQSGREWIWITGNHDPAPLPFPGPQKAEHRQSGLTFRHIAQSDTTAEISGHFHPKTRVVARGRSLTRASFVLDCDRVILPAFGAYTGGLYSDDPAIRDLFRPSAIAVLTGPVASPVPLAATLRKKSLKK